MSVDVDTDKPRDIRDHAKIRRGPVFRRITAAGTIEGRLTGDGVYKILKAQAAAANSLSPTPSGCRRTGCAPG
jgi:hypothetical protein